MAGGPQPSVKDGPARLRARAVVPPSWRSGSGKPAGGAIQRLNVLAERCPVSLTMSLEDARRISDALLASRGTVWNRPLRDLLWLRVVLVEQWRRTPKGERGRFERRAEVALDAFWVGATGAIPSAPVHTVKHHGTT